MIATRQWAFPLVALLVAGALFGQSPEAKIKPAKPWQMKSFGKNAERVGDYYTAIDYYEQYCKAKPRKMAVGWRLAECYRKARNYPAAKEQYLKCYSFDEDKYTKGLFWYAAMLKTEGQYAEAKENLLKFKKAYRGRKDSREYSKRVKSEVKGCEIAPNLIDTPNAAIITHLSSSVNKANIEFSPLPLDDNTLIYATLPSDTVVWFGNADSTLNIPKRKFLVAEKKDGKWESKGEFDGPFNDEEFNVGNGMLSPDGERLYFTRCKRNWANRMICGIWYSDKIGNAWGKPKPLPENVNTPKFTATMPAIGNESKKSYEVVYFSSDRPGGKGGMDLWYTIYDKRKKIWKDPKNCGTKINTVGDEITPFFDKETRTLYFSSDGWPGLGGLDIFKVNGELKKWTTPENIGTPVNGGTDELYYILDKNKEEGFFTSNRPGTVALGHETCCDDIYQFQYTEYVHVAVNGKVFEVNCKEIEKIEAKAKTTNNFEIKDISKVALQDAHVELYLIDDQTGELIFININESDIQGDYYFFKLEAGRYYKLIISKEGYFNRIIEIPTHQLSFSDTIKRDVGLCKIPKEPIVIKNIYYPFDKAYLTDTAMSIIDTTIYEILVENPHIIVEISSHTDSKGSDAYNESLSQRRAESVVRYLIKKGIDKNRLQAKGYGEYKPIAPNTNPDGSDDPIGRAKNRRTEFRVVGTLEQYSGVEYEE